MHFVIKQSIAFQRACTGAGLIIPTNVVDGANLAAPTNNFETYCGGAFSPLGGSTTPGVVTSE